MDLLIYDRYESDKRKYILVVIDVYSRYAQARALNNRENQTIIKELKDIFNVMGEPVNINCDNEFNKKMFNDYFSKLDITPWYSDPDESNKNAIVERFNRTLAKLIQRWRLTYNNNKWYKVLSDLIDNYNHTYHRTIKTDPYSVFHGEEQNNQDIIRTNKKLKVGDLVRYVIKKKVFDKGDVIRLSKKIYTVNNIKKNRFYLQDLEDNQILDNGFKDYELHKVDNVDEDKQIEIIESVAKEHKERTISKKTNKELESVFTEKITKPEREKREIKLSKKYFE